MSDLNVEPDLISVVERLEAERPVPRAAFRGELRRHLVVGMAKHRARPARLRLLINAWAGSGSALLAFAAAGVAGIGPFSA